VKSFGEEREAGTAARDADEMLRFFEPLATSDDEKAFLKGCRESIAGNERAAFEHWRKATRLVDAAYLAGFMALKEKHGEEASRYLEGVQQRQAELGRSLSKYGINVHVSLPITPQVAANVGVSLQGLLLGLTEAYQMMGRVRDAANCVYRLHKQEPQDLVVKLSLAELMWEAGASETQCCEIVRLGEGIRNESAIHGALLLYKAKALRHQGMNDAALEVVTDAFAITDDRPKDLLRAMRYELALIYDAKGDASRARAEFERLYAEAPGYEDVAARLGRQPKSDWTNVWNAVKGRADGPRVVD
jgi:tetratricopeptide (TPR) repeat protein